MTLLVTASCVHSRVSEEETSAASREESCIHLTICAGAGQEAGHTQPPPPPLLDCDILQLFPRLCRCGTSVLVHSLGQCSLHLPHPCNDVALIHGPTTAAVSRSSQRGCRGRRNVACCCINCWRRWFCGCHLVHVDQSLDALGTATKEGGDRVVLGLEPVVCGGCGGGGEWRTWGMVCVTLCACRFTLLLALC